MTDYLETGAFIQDLISAKETAWVALFKRHYKTIFQFSFKLVQDDEHARDITIDTFIKLYEDPSRFNNTHSIKNVLAYLYVVARNACLNHLKMTRRRIQREMIYHGMMATEKDIELIMVESQVMEELHARFEQLPKHWKDTIHLICIQGMSYKEAAESLGVSIHSIKGYKTAALDKLRQYVTDNSARTSLTLLLLYFSINN